MTSGQPTSLLRRVACWAPWGALAAVAAALTLQDIRSFDYWWHLRTGQLIAETGAVPRSDPFTFSVPGARWIDIHWLHQIGLHVLYTAGGHATVVLAIFALVCVWLALLAPIGWRRDRAWLAAGALAWMLVVAANRLKPRPELPSFVLLAALLALFDRFSRRGDRTVYWVVPIQLLWVNLHGLFAVGLAVCGIELVAELLRPLGRAGEGLRRERVRRLAITTALALLVSFVNPNGVAGALYPLQQFQMVGPAGGRGPFGTMVNELLPPIGTFGALGLSLFLGLAGASFAALCANWRRVREADALLWVAFFYLALGAGRNVSLFAVVAAPLLVRNLNPVLDARRFPPRADLAAAALVSALALFVAIDAVRGRFYARIGPYRTAGFGVIEGFNPIGAAEWILRARPPAPIAHSLSDGGYLIWRLWPDYRVLSDGRLEVFGPEILPGLQFFDAEGFERLDARYHFGSVLLNHRRHDVRALVAWLHANPGWRLVYLDDVSLVFVRADGEGARLPLVDLDAPDLFPALDGVPELPARERMIARTRLALDLGRPGLAVRQWKRLLERFPDEPRGREMLEALRARRAELGGVGERH